MLSADPSALGPTGVAACAAEEGDFKAEVLLLKLSEAVRWTWGMHWQVCCFLPIVGGVLHVQKLVKRE